MKSFNEFLYWHNLAQFGTTSLACNIEASNKSQTYVPMISNYAYSIYIYTV